MVQSRAAQDRNADNINKVFTFHNYNVNIAKVLKPVKVHINMYKGPDLLNPIATCNPTPTEQYIAVLTKAKRWWPESL